MSKGAATSAASTASAASGATLPLPGFKGRMTFLMVFCLAFGGAVVTRAAYLQLYSIPRLDSMARRQFQSKVLIQPRRGTIMDRNGEPLAVNVETNSLAANPSKIQNKKTLARLIAKAAELPYPLVLHRLTEKREFVWLKRHLNEAELNRFKRFRLIDSDGDLASGLWLVKESQRVYPHGELAAHVIGDVNIDSEGVEGTELWFNEKMRGKVVSVSAVKDALGRPSFIDAVAANHVKDGDPVSLTIDASLQFAVEQALKGAVDKTQSRSGSVIVMNAANGEILAMANQPSFNPNDKGVPLDRRRNRVLTDGYEPGSTMKAVLLATALSHGMKLTDTVYGEHGNFKVQGKRIAEAEAKEKFDWISLKKVIQVSSNIGAAKIALKVGADHYYNMLKAFGFGAKTGTLFPGEISGRVLPRKEWSPLSLANIGFGQGVLVTPMQMIRAYAAFLNGGWLVQPTLLKNPDQAGFKVEVPRRIIAQKVADDVVTALGTVTADGGTGLKANVNGYNVAGKTGTAQEVDPSNGHYSRSKHIASFIGFATGVEPKLVILTRLDEPHGIYFASETAAPLFHEVLNAVVTRFSIPATQPMLTRKLASSDHIHATQAKTVESPVVPQTLEWQGTAPGGALQWKMPLLKGLTAREAIRALQGHPFRLEVHGTGVIQHQFPEEGKSLSDGETVRLSLVEP